MIKCTFTSEWDDGSVVETYCEYNPETGFVDPDVSDGPIPEGSLVREYITLTSGEELEVCRNCHTYVLKNGECMGADPDCTREDGE